MGFLVDAMSPGAVDGQRDVVKNERRQGVENQPYGRVEDLLPSALFPKDHPYSWPVIGSMVGDRKAVEGPLKALGLESVRTLTVDDVMGPAPAVE
jgi:zinc protease